MVVPSGPASWVTSPLGVHGGDDVAPRVGHLQFHPLPSGARGGQQPVAQVVDSLAGARRHQHGTRVTPRQGVAVLVVEQVHLVQHQQSRHIMGADLVEHLLDGYLPGGTPLVVLAGVGHVDDQVGVAHLLQRRAEGLDKLMGEMPDEPHGVADQHLHAILREGARGGVEGLEEGVLHVHVRAGERVHQA